MCLWIICTHHYCCSVFISNKMHLQTHIIEVYVTEILDHLDLDNIISFNLTASSRLARGIGFISHRSQRINTSLWHDSSMGSHFHQELLCLCLPRPAQRTKGAPPAPAWAWVKASKKHSDPKSRKSGWYKIWGAVFVKFWWWWWPEYLPLEPIHTEGVPKKSLQ